MKPSIIAAAVLSMSCAQVTERPITQTRPPEYECSQDGEPIYFIDAIDDQMMLRHIIKLECIAGGDVTINTREAPRIRYHPGMPMDELFAQGTDCSAGALYRETPEGRHRGFVSWRRGRYIKYVDSLIDLIHDSLYACEEAKNPGI